MPPKKQKAQKMALKEFFADSTSGSWAEEMEALPTAPAARGDVGPRRGEPGYLDSMPDRSQRSFSGAPQMREDVPLPDVPPFTAFVGNLTFETEEVELGEFFDDLSPVSVRLISDPTGKPKGFGYVEFPSRDNLKAALDRNGANLGGRGIRVNVADAPATRRDFGPSAADSSDQWRRATPLPQREAPAPRRNFSGISHTSNDDRDWGAARGAKFTPSAPSAPSRESSGYGRPRTETEHSPSVADEAGQWRSARPMVEAASPQRGGPGRDAPPHKAHGPADTEKTWARGTRVPAAPAAPAEPTRHRLNLLPRSSAPSSAEEGSPANSKASPFGAARPVDTATREAELASHAEERRNAQQKAREDAKAAAEARAEAREKQREEERVRRPVRVHPSRLPPKESPQADEDGFESVPTRGARAPAAAEEDKPKPAAATKSANKGFSFSAAAGALDDDVDEVANQVANVSV